MVLVLANSAEPDEMPHDVAFHPHDVAFHPHDVAFHPHDVAFHLGLH